MKKKILAGVLAAASALSMSVSAFAAENEKNVTKPGEIEYDVPVNAPTVVLNLTMPAKLQAALNPYGADIKLKEASAPDKDDAVTTSAGIASLAYTITNNSQEYGIYIDATAVTTVETADKTKWTVSKAALKDGTKGAQLYLTGSDTVANLKTAIEKLDGTDALDDSVKPAEGGRSGTTQGLLAMDSTVVADKATGVVAGQTSMKKLFYVAAATKADATVTPGSIVVGFGGTLAASSDDTEVEWTEDDAINVNLVLKVTAGPKTLPTT